MWMSFMATNRWLVSERVYQYVLTCTFVFSVHLQNIWTKYPGEGMWIYIFVTVIFDLCCRWFRFLLLFACSIYPPGNDNNCNRLSNAVVLPNAKRSSDTFFEVCRSHTCNKTKRLVWLVRCSAWWAWVWVWVLARWRLGLQFGSFHSQGVSLTQLPIDALFRSLFTKVPGSKPTPTRSVALECSGAHHPMMIWSWVFNQCGTVLRVVSIIIPFRMP